MKLSEEMAVRLHRMMWSDMQKELGNRPTGRERQKFKYDWIRKQFPGESIASDCWLCEYASSKANRGDGDPYCKHCPISWPNGHCNTLDYSYAKEPISDILALPARNKSLAAEDNEEKAHILYYEYREGLLSKASGIPASSYIEDHVKAIQEKAVEEYFEKKPAAKLATMDVDQAFEQYAEEVKAPIFKALAKESGLSENNHNVSDHIDWIKCKTRAAGDSEGRASMNKFLKESLAEESGLRWEIPVSDHIAEIKRKGGTYASSLLVKYKECLSDTSGLDIDKPVDEHVRAIFNNGFEAGKEQAKDDLLDKIEGILWK